MAKLGLIVLMASLAVLGVLIEPVREFFLLEWPAWSTWGVIAVGGGAAVAGIQVLAVARWVLALGSRANRPRQ